MFLTLGNMTRDHCRKRPGPWRHFYAILNAAAERKPHTGILDRLMRTISTLLVEDEALIRMMLAQMVEDLGHLIVSEAANIEAAISLAETRSFDLALLDINIAGSLVTPVVHILDRRSVPIVF